MHFQPIPEGLDTKAGAILHNQVVGSISSAKPDGTLYLALLFEDETMALYPVSKIAQSGKAFSQMLGWLGKYRHHRLPASLKHRIMSKPEKAND